MKRREKEEKMKRVNKEKEDEDLKGRDKEEKYETKNMDSPLKSWERMIASRNAKIKKSVVKGRIEQPRAKMEVKKSQLDATSPVKTVKSRIERRPKCKYIPSETLERKKERKRKGREEISSQVHEVIDVPSPTKNTPKKTTTLPMIVTTLAEDGGQVPVHKGWIEMSREYFGYSRLTNVEHALIDHFLNMTMCRFSKVI